MIKKTVQVEIFGIAFLDVLTCTLGALIILFTIIPKYPPTKEQELNVIQKLQSIIFSLKKENNNLSNELNKNTQTKVETKTPTLFGVPLNADKATFVIDVSGSMQWQEINLYNTLESLLLSSDINFFKFIYFDEIVYSSKKYWKYGWFEGTESNKKNALRESKKILSELIYYEPATTNSGEALYQALKNGDSDCIYFLTDGYPTSGETNIDRILLRIKKANRKDAKINPVMIGLPGTTLDQYGNVVFDPNAKPKELYEFLHTLANENNGVYIGR